MSRLLFRRWQVDLKLANMTFVSSIGFTKEKKDIAIRTETDSVKQEEFSVQLQFYVSVFINAFSKKKD